MTALEKQLARLLKEAAGEPPTTIDADALISGVRRRRPLGPWFAAAAVVLLAVSLTWVGSDRPARHAAAPPTSLAPSPGVPHGPASEPHSSAARTPAPTPAAGPAQTSPRAVALHQIKALLAAAPVPPGAARTTVDGRRGALQFVTSSSAHELRVIGAFTAAGTVNATAQYVTDRAPAGMHLNCAQCGSASGRYFEFDAPGGQPEIDYNISAYRGGVYIRIEVWTTYVPSRPAWSFVPRNVTSATVVVKRTPLSSASGAPTVRRTLSSTAALRLATAVNALTPVAGTLNSAKCAPPLSVEAYDAVQFHSPFGDLKFEYGRLGCGLDATTNKPGGSSNVVYLTGPMFEAAVLDALGLPHDYGRS